MNVNCHAPLDAALASQRLGSIKKPEAESETARQAASGRRSCGTVTGPGAGPNGTFVQSDLDALKADWGKSGSQYDLNSDGTVDVNDLLAMINDWQAAPDVPSTPAPTVVEAVPDEPAAIACNQATLDQIQADWGQSGSSVDTNGDDTIDINDLLYVINNWEQAATPAAPSVDLAPTKVTAVSDETTSAAPQVSTKPAVIRLEAIARAMAKGRLHAATLDAPTSRDVRRIGRALVDRFMAAGFTQRPPTNLREVVDQLKLGGAERKSLMSQLRAQYPQGLGVNLRA